MPPPVAIQRIERAIAMRDGVELRTLILIPGTPQPQPMLLERSPYGEETTLPTLRRLAMRRSSSNTRPSRCGPRFLDRGVFNLRPEYLGTVLHAGGTFGGAGYKVSGARGHGRMAGNRGRRPDRLRTCAKPSWKNCAVHVTNKFVCKDRLALL
jgi:hypothetical protein